MLESEGGKMVIKTIEGNNIDHKKFIKELGDSCEVKLSDLKDGVQKCLINTQTNSVSKLRLQCGESSINISYFDYLEDTLATQTIDCKNFIKFTNQEDGVFFLNGVFLLDILKNMHQETVSLFFKPTGREVILKNFAWYVSIKLIQIK